MSPYVIVSCAVSLDGYLDDASGERLMLSNAEDFDRVDELRASCDAIMVGANTIRKDNPSLCIKSPERRGRRAQAHKPEHPLKVTLTEGGDLGPAARFFSTDGKKLVACGARAHAALAERLRSVAEVISVPPRAKVVEWLLKILSERGVNRLLVEGGSDIITAFLASGKVDELRLAVAPFLVGERDAPRFVKEGVFPFTNKAPLTLIGVERVGNVAVLHYRR